MIDIKTIESQYRSEHVPRPQTSKYDIKRSRSSKSLQTLFQIKSSSLRQRSRACRKQRSLIWLAKWAIYDRGKLEEKVRRVKGLIDGLEDILRAAGTVLPREGYFLPPNNDFILRQENPPPYSSLVPIQSPHYSTVTRTPQPVISRLSDNSIFDMLEHHAGMKRYLTGFPDGGGLAGSRHRDLLSKLTTQQFKELRMDVFDELLRRQESNSTTPQWLPDIPSYHPKRNEARRKLATIIAAKFSQLLFDIVSELERRFPHLQDPTPRSSSPVSTTGSLVSSPSTMSCNQSRRWGCVGSNDGIYTPPPYLKYRAAHQATVRTNLRRQASTIHVTGNSESSIQTTEAIVVPARGPIEIFKSFPVSMDDPTSKVLPAALRKYDIQAPWHQYSLYIIYGIHERKVELHEKPLMIYHRLDKEGKKPVFMLRKVQQAALVASGGEESEAQSPMM